MTLCQAPLLLEPNLILEIAVGDHRKQFKGPTLDTPKALTRYHTLQMYSFSLSLSLFYHLYNKQLKVRWGEGSQIKRSHEKKFTPSGS